MNLHLHQEASDVLRMRMSRFQRGQQASFRSGKFTRCLERTPEARVYFGAFLASIPQAFFQPFDCTRRLPRAY